MTCLVVIFCLGLCIGIGLLPNKFIVGLFG